MIWESFQVGFEQALKDAEMKNEWPIQLWNQFFSMFLNAEHISKRRDLDQASSKCQLWKCIKSVPSPPVGEHEVFLQVYLSLEMGQMVLRQTRLKQRVTKTGKGQNETEFYLVFQTPGKSHGRWFHCLKKKVLQHSRDFWQVSICNCDLCSYVFSWKSSIKGKRQHHI